MIDNTNPPIKITLQCHETYKKISNMEKRPTGNAMFLAPLAVGQQAYVMARCPSCVRPSVRASVRPSVRPCVNFFFKHLLR